MSPSSEFALELHSRLPASGNLFYSPWSLRSALAMTQAGAGGATASEMARVLQLGREDSWVPSARGVTLRSANALWADESVALEGDYLAVCEGRFGGRCAHVPFTKDPEAAVKTINAWVSERTEGLIPQTLGEASADIRLVLTNAVYFKGAWDEAFPTENTLEFPFHAEGGAELAVDMLQRRGEYRYAALKGLQVLEIPYKGGDVSMLILLPADKDGLPELEKRLTVETLKEWAGAARPRAVQVLLPRFKLNEETETLKALGEMGLKEAFSPKADFSAMSRSERLFIGDIVHKAFVEVGEEGTEAAAVTAVAMALGCDIMVEDAEQPPVFMADRPFLFLIRDGSGEILFMGRLARPEPKR